MSYSNASGSHAISNSTDVALNTPADGNVLTYSAGVQKWINSVPTSGSGSSINDSTASTTTVWSSSKTSTAIAAVSAGSGDGVSLSSYSPVADGLYGLTGSIASGSKNLTFSTGGLSSAQVGAVVSVAGAGASGAPLVTTVSSVTNATTAVLATAASTTVSAVMTLIGHDNQTAFYNALQAAGNKRLTIPKGIYYVGNTVQILAGTKVDLTGVTILSGGFVPATGCEISNGLFIGDKSGVYGTAIYVANTPASNVTISGNKFQYHNWAILQNIQTSAIVALQHWNISNNWFDNMQLGCTYIGGLIDSKFDNNLSTNIVAGCNTYNFQNTVQRTAVTNNTVNGGRAGIIFLAGVEYMPVTATQPGEVFGNYIAGNRVIGQTEEGISFDGTMSIDNLTIASINTTNKTVTVLQSAYASAGNKFQYYWINVLSGSLTSRIFRITAMSNQTFTLEIDATDIAAFTVGDSLTVALPFRHNRVENNHIDGRNSSTYSIWLYGMSVHNTLSGNTIDGSTIGLASLNSMAPTGLSIQSSLTTSSSSGFNVINGNTISGFSSVAATYSNGPGIELAYVQYGNQTDVYTYGNIVSNNIVPNGAIVGQRNQKLSANNIARGGSVYTTTPSSAPLSFV